MDTERTSSIQVSENAKGQKSYAVKLYFDLKEDEAIEINKKIEDIYEDLHQKFNK